MTKRLARFASVTFTLIGAGFFAFAVAYTSPGNPTGFVNDFANIIDESTQAALETKLSAFEVSTTHEIVVVIIPTLGDDYIENYAVKLFEEWGIGKKDSDNGILFLVALDDKKVRIEVGYGLEGALVDSEVNTIIQDYVLPKFRENNYVGGIESGVDGIIAATEGEEVSNASSVANVNWSEIAFFIIFALFWGVNILIQIFASSKSWWLGGVLGGGAGAIITLLGLFGVTITLGLFISFILAILGLILDYFVSKNASSILSKFSKGGRGGPWIGGGGFGGGSSSGGFGGFGGGGSGGGGSSGSW